MKRSTKPQKFRICFVYSENGKLRVKQHEGEAVDMSAAIDKLKEKYPEIKITSVERIS